MLGVNRQAPYMGSMSTAFDTAHPRDTASKRFVEKTHSLSETTLPAPEDFDAAAEVEQELFDTAPDWFGQLTPEDFAEMADDFEDQ